MAEIEAHESKLYSEFAPLYDKIFGKIFYNRLEKVIEDLDIPVGAKVLAAFAKDHEQFVIKGGAMPNVLMSVKDVKALARFATDRGYAFEILHAVEAVNRRQKGLLFEKISQFFGGQLKGKTIALWGLAFKPNTDDMREAPSRVLIGDLTAAGAKVRAYDPAAAAEAKRIFSHDPSVQICGSALETVEGADALAIVTEWQEFRSPDFRALNARLRTPAIFDGRNLYDPAVLKAQGFEYFPIGRRT